MKYYTDNAQVVSIGRAAFPEYTGRKFAVIVIDGKISVRSYWSGGSSDFYNFVRLSDLKVFGEIPQQSMFDRAIPGAESVQLVPGLACVRHSLFCGKDMGLEIMVHPSDGPKLLPDSSDADKLSDDERIVLTATRKWKSSYGGKSNVRFHESRRFVRDLTVARWDAAKVSLIGRGCLNKSGAITMNGRNVEQMQPYKFTY